MQTGDDHDSGDDKDGGDFPGTISLHMLIYNKCYSSGCMATHYLMSVKT